MSKPAKCVLLCVLFISKCIKFNYIRYYFCPCKCFRQQRKQINHNVVFAHWPCNVVGHDGQMNALHSNYSKAIPIMLMVILLMVTIMLVFTTYKSLHDRF